jgi:hypothetical protein
VYGSETSAITSFVWAIDRTPPVVSSISRLDPSPTNAGTVRWGVSFSESVNGVDAGDFALVRTGGITGGTVSSVTPTATGYTVSATTGSGNGTLGLNLVDNDTIRDSATNPLGGPGAGNGTVAGPVYTIDRTPPSKPVFSQTPPNPSSSAVATFAWSSQPAADVSRYECSQENGAWFTCTSPRTYTVAATNNGTHQFAVRAVDAAGNVSTSASYNWKVTQTNGAPFQVTGSLSGLTIGRTTPITITLTNPNTVAIYVTSLSVSIASDSTPSGCLTASNIALVQPSGISSSTPFTIPASSSVVLPVAQSPTITLINRPDVNQDVCKNKSFALTYGGSAHS